MLKRSTNSVIKEMFYDDETMESDIEWFMEKTFNKK